MGRILITSTDLKGYVGNTVTIAGSDCCWNVVEETTVPDESLREVVVTSINCYYDFGSGGLGGRPKIVTL